MGDSDSCCQRLDLMKPFVCQVVDARSHKAPDADALPGQCTFLGRHSQRGDAGRRGNRWEWGGGGFQACATRFSARVYRSMILARSFLSEHTSTVPSLRYECLAAVRCGASLCERPALRVLDERPGRGAKHVAREAPRQLERDTPRTLLYKVEGAVSMTCERRSRRFRLAPRTC